MNDYRLSPHLMASEVWCKGNGCCDKGMVVIPAAVDLFERIRKQSTLCVGHDCPITPTSGVRCPIHNSRVARTGKTGPHTKGIALDLPTPEGMTDDEFHGVCLACNPNGGVGFYRDKHMVHVDVRGQKARWEE